MIDRNKMIFFNTANMEFYQGNWTDDVPINGGAYIKEHGWGGEVYNFQPFNGMMYGYVEPGHITDDRHQRRINISRFVKHRARTESISGMTVIWVARPGNRDTSVMRGWYENATVFRSSQHLTDDHARILPDGSYDYFVSARASDCHLIPKGVKSVDIPRGPGGLGHSNIWYATGTTGEQIKDKVIDYINKLGQNQSEEVVEEEKVEALIRQNGNLTVTEKDALIKARNGQGKFRNDVLTLHKNCPFTGVNNHRFLTASHLKPWAKSDNNERLDPLNGIPLTPVADQLLDQGFLTFDDTGLALFSKQINADELKSMGIAIDKIYKITVFDPRQKQYLKYHREHVFEKWIKNDASDV